MSFNFVSNDEGKWADIEKINAALKAVNGIQTTIFELMQSLLRVPQFAAEYSDESENFIKKIQTLLQQLQDKKTDLDKCAAMIFHPSVQLRDNIGYTATLALDQNYDKTTLTTNQILSYRYLGNLQEYCQFAAQAISSKLLKRNLYQKQRQARSQPPNNHHYPVIKIEQFFQVLERSQGFQKICPIQISKPFGLFVLVRFPIDNSMKVVLVFRGCLIEYVQIKGYDESFEDPSIISLNSFEKRILYSHHHPDAKFDLWTPSKYEIFRTITQHANSAILHFYAPNQMETAVKAFVNWLKSYSNQETSLFMVQCRKCESRLLNGMPPTWRDFRSSEPFHFECRP